jgi:hypothetical protein
LNPGAATAVVVNGTPYLVDFGSGIVGAKSAAAGAVERLAVDSSSG